MCINIKKGCFNLFLLPIITLFFTLVPMFNLDLNYTLFISVKSTCRNGMGVELSNFMNRSNQAQQNQFRRSQTYQFPFFLSLVLELYILRMHVPGIKLNQSPKNYCSRRQNSKDAKSAHSKGTRRKMNSLVWTSCLIGCTITP